MAEEEKTPEQEKEEKKETKRNKLLATQEESTKNMESAAIRLENANAEFKANRMLAEQAQVQEQLQGKSEAGKDSKKEETPLEYKNRVMRGEL